MSVAKYGIGYMGGKTTLAEKFISLFPSAPVFYDLFAGGCSMTHAAILSGKYKKFVANDLDGRGLKLFLRAAKGEFVNDTQWVGRERFFNERESDIYVALTWSYGSNCVNYTYSAEIDPWKKALHYAWVKHDLSLMREIGIEGDCSRAYILKNYEEIKAKYMEWYLKTTGDIAGYDKIKRYKNMIFVTLKHEGNRQRLVNIAGLDVSNLTAIYGDYADVEIEPDGFVYLDIPYDGSADYFSRRFNHKRFYEWTKQQKATMVVSSYKAPDDWDILAEFNHGMSFAPRKNRSVSERLFIPHWQRDRWVGVGLISKN